MAATLTRETLDQEAIAHAVALAAALKQHEEEKARTKDAARAEERRAILAEMSSILGADLVEALGAEARVADYTREQQSPGLYFAYCGVRLRATMTAPRGKVSIGADGYTQAPIDRDEVPCEAARRHLLATLGQVKVWAEDQAAKQAEWAAQRAQRDAQEDARAAVEAAARTELERQASEANAAEDARVAAAWKDLWAWPEGAAVTLYRLRWATAPAMGEGAEYDTGYAPQSRINYSLPVWLYPERHRGERRLRLLPEVHLPIIEELACAGLGDLPRALVEEVTIEVARREVRHGYIDEDAYPVRVGERPVAWVRALVEAAAAGRDS